MSRYSCLRCLHLNLIPNLFWIYLFLVNLFLRFCVYAKCSILVFEHLINKNIINIRLNILNIVNGLLSLSNGKIQKN